MLYRKQGKSILQKLNSSFKILLALYICFLTVKPCTNDCFLNTRNFEVSIQAGTEHPDEHNEECTAFCNCICFHKIISKINSSITADVAVSIFDLSSIDGTILISVKPASPPPRT